MRSIRAMRDARTALAIAAAAAIALLGCSQTVAAPIAGEGGDDAAPRRGGTLRMATIGDIRNGLDPDVSPDGLSLAVMNLLYAGLVRYDAEGTIVPDVAERWEIADEGRTYRFFLRAGVTMHDGEELTADDVKRSIERALHPTTPNANASYFTNLVGERAYAAGKSDRLAGVAVENRYVVAFHLVSPDATFLYLLAMPTMRPLCRTAGRRYVDTWAPCGAGPFKLVPGGWQRGMSLRLVRHDAYFRTGHPYLDAVEWSYNVPAITQRLRFEHGDIDLARELTYADETHYAADPRWAKLGFFLANTTIYGEAMNTRIPPFDNVEIRRAVAAAIDRDHYRLVQPMRMSVLLQALPGKLAEPDVPAQRYDYAAALDHMRKAGYPYDPATGKGGWPEPIDYVMYSPSIPFLTGQLLQQDLAKIGVRLRLKVVSWPAFLALQQRPDGAAMSQGNWQLDFPDPSSVFEPVFTTSAIAPEGSLNTAFYSNPHLDDLVARAHLEMDPAKRRALYREADAIVCDDAPWAFTFAYHYFVLHQPYVHGLVAPPTGHLDVADAWLDRPPSAGDAR